MREEPKPCQFCGESDFVVYRPSHDCVVCRNCYARGPIYDDGDPEQAVRLWNKRVPDHLARAKDDIVEAAKALYNHGPCTVVIGPHGYADAYAISKETMDPLFDAVSRLAEAGKKG